MQNKIKKNKIFIFYIMKDMQSMFKKLCTPAKIYLVIAIVSSIISLFSKGSMYSVVIHLLFALFWAYILSWLCKKGYSGISWTLLLLPYVIFLLAMVGIMKMV